MKTTEKTWQQWYSEKWNELLAQLPEDKREMVLASPEGRVAADLAAQAYRFADKQVHGL